MIADINIHEKSFGLKVLMHSVKFSVDDGEKIGVIGRNGVGKSTLFGILTGSDKDYSGDVIYRRGTVVVATAQEHHSVGEQTVLQYVLEGLPEYAALSKIIVTYPETMGDDMKKITEYSEALERFDQKGFYQIEEQIERELDNFQLAGLGQQKFGTLSGGQKRLVEVIKIMHSQAQLALVDEPTNHMDFVAKAQFIDWMRAAKEAVLVITHDRDVLREVDRIVELKDGGAVSYKGNYDAYLKQNAVSTGASMNEFEMIEKRIANLKVKVLDYQRLKEKSRNPGTIQKFKRLEEQSRKELAELQAKEKPTFWIDKQSAESLNYKVASQYDKFKARNIRMQMKSDKSRSKHVLVRASNVSIGYTAPLFDSVNIDLREGEAVELRGRNGAGKTTLIKKLLAGTSWGLESDGFLSPLPSASATSIAPPPSKSPQAAPPIGSAGSDLYGNSERISNDGSGVLGGGANETEEDDDSASENSETTASNRPLCPTIFAGELSLDPKVRVGVYEQEVSPKYFDTPLAEAIERMYLDRNLSISTTKIRGLLHDYLFDEGDANIPLKNLSGGQKARFQIISMLADDPQLLILDEPTNHLDLPSIEELEGALQKYAGAILYVSHDGYFQDAIGGEVVKI